MLPNKNGAIDWDAVADDYFNQVLSPWAPPMVAPDATGRVRNPLIEYLRGELAAQTPEQPALADFGCGPGNLIPHLPAAVGTLTCVDQSRAALDRARARGERHGIRVNTVLSDIAALDAGHRYDRIFSVNALLPDMRAGVHAQLAAIRRCLNPGGRLLAILPSFDTTEYLLALRRDRDRAAGLSDTEVTARQTQWIAAHKMDPAELAYADDGHHVQCYHTDRSIHREFAANGLAVIGRPQKVYYPWSLARRFGYGDFPEAGEEIWDWFVVAGRAQ